MKIRKWHLATVFVATALILTGCSGQNQSAKKSSSSKPTTSVVSHKSKKTNKTQVNNKQATVLWDSSKDNQLKVFIDQWGPTMKQSYVKYDGSNSLKTSTGTIYPDDLSKVTVEGANASIGWSKDGKGTNEYNIVAIYNYNGTVPPLPNHITYFFAFHNNQPIVLVDQSRDGTPNLVETGNKDLKSGFNDIVAGKKAAVNSNTEASNNKQSSQLVTDPKMVGVMVYQIHGAQISSDVAKLLSVYTANGRYWIGTGTSLSNVGYTISGETVTYYTPHYNDDTEKDDWIPHNISLRDLENQYYSSNDQKQNVQAIAGQMPSIDNMDD